MTHYWLTVHRSSSPTKARTGSQVARLLVLRLVQREGWSRKSGTGSGGETALTDISGA